MRLPVHLQRDIARQHFYDPTLAHRAISRTTGTHHDTIRKFRQQVDASGLSWQELSPLDDDAWRAALGTQDRSVAQLKTHPDCEWIHNEMRRPDATLERLWREWRETTPEGVGYSQFAMLYRVWTKNQHVVMRRTHRPGEKLFVDFAGRTVEIRDQNGGPSTFAQIFVAVLGYSNYTYIEATASQTTKDWLKCHANCFEALGGVPEWVVSDNLKAAVWRRERDRTVINPAYRDCLSHYDTAPLPTGARKPKHKAKAEVGVQIAQRWALFSLRDRIFFSLAELNAELRIKAEEMNRHPFKRLPGCRLDRFLETEKASLKPLPGTAFELSDWRYSVRVQDDYHVEHQRRFYSVPHTLARESVDLRFTATVIEIFHRGRRVALHPLIEIQGNARTIPEHRPVIHSRVLDAEPRALLAWAMNVGGNVELMIRHQLENRSDITNVVKAARRMRDLARDYGEVRFEEVCAYAMPLNITSLRSITSILKEDADKRFSITQAPKVKIIGELRGPSYFGESA